MVNMAMPPFSRRACPGAPARWHLPRWHRYMYRAAMNRASIKMTAALRPFHCNAACIPLCYHLWSAASGLQSIRFTGQLGVRCALDTGCKGFFDTCT